jgi:hypothetical protein
VLTENTQKEGDSEVAASRMDETASGPVGSNGKEIGSESTQKQQKKEGNILMFDTMFSLTDREEAGLKIQVGATTRVQVKEAATVSETWARRHCAGRTGKVKIVST